MNGSRSPYYSSYEHSSVDVSGTEDNNFIEDQYRKNKAAHTYSNNRDSLYRESSRLEFRSKKFFSHKYEFDNAKHIPVDKPWQSIYNRIIKSPKVTSIKEIGMRIHSVISNTDQLKEQSKLGFVGDLMNKFEDFSQINLNSTLKKIQSIKMKKKRPTIKKRMSALVTTPQGHIMMNAIREKISAMNLNTHNTHGQSKGFLQKQKSKPIFMRNAEPKMNDKARNRVGDLLNKESLSPIRINKVESTENFNNLVSTSTYLQTEDTLNIQSVSMNTMPSNLKSNKSVGNTNFMVMPPLSFLSKLQKGDLNKVKQRSNFFNDILFEAIKNDLALNKLEPRIFEEITKDKDEELQTSNCMYR